MSDYHCSGLYSDASTGIVASWSGQLHGRLFGILEVCVLVLGISHNCLAHVHTNRVLKTLLKPFGSEDGHFVPVKNLRICTRAVGEAYYCVCVYCEEYAV